MVDLSLKQIASALKGDISGDQVLCPGPGHSAKDRSLSVKPSAAKSGFVVYSFANDDPMVCRDYVSEKLGLTKFTPTPKAERFSMVAITAAAMQAAAEQQSRKPTTAEAIYRYEDRDGTLLYEVLRLLGKKFVHRLPDSDGGWLYKGSSRRVVYRWPELIKFPNATVFVCEGEKDADRVASLDLCATTVASGKWTDDCIQALAGRDCWILEDNDEAGRKKALEAATRLHPVAGGVKIVRFPSLPHGGDVSDWLDMGRTKDDLEDFCCSTPDWQPESSSEPHSSSNS